MNSHATLPKFLINIITIIQLNRSNHISIFNLQFPYFYNPSLPFLQKSPFLKIPCNIGSSRLLMFKRCLCQSIGTKITFIHSICIYQTKIKLVLLKAYRKASFVDLFSNGNVDCNIIYEGFEAQKGFYTPLGIIYVTESQ